VWEERRAWIAKQQQSGLSVAHFCREHGLHARNFHSWRYRLGEGPIGGVGPLAGKSTMVGSHKQRQAFVQLALPATTVAPASSATSGGAAWVEISSASGVVVRVPGSNLAALQIVLNSLNRAGQESQHV
jgi:transposase-like protein